MKMKQSAVDLPELITRNKETLDDYLYEPYSPFQDKNAGKVIKSSLLYSFLIIWTTCS